jgi:beta-lactamase regulating signal transducer with metallopeptidase domain
MESLLSVVLLNALWATGMAGAAWLAGRVVRRPAVVHALWAAVLLKLLTPPILPVPVLPASRSLGGVPSSATEATTPTARTVETLTAAQSVVGTDAARTPEAPGHGPATFESMAAIALVAGSAVVLFVSLARARRLGDVLRAAQPAPPDVRARVLAFANRLGLRRSPQPRLIGARLPPLVLPAPGRPLLLLPERLVAQLEDDELDALLVHELAHVRRGDHWFRLIEAAATVLFWWHPVTWWARRQLRYAEERCCDEWVLRLLPGAGRDHADGLLKAAAFISGQVLPMPATATTALRAADLRSRLTALLSEPPSPPLGGLGQGVLAAVLLVPLAAFPSSCREEALGELTADLAVQAGAPGDPLVKYVGLPVKVLPEAEFAAVLQAAQRQAHARWADQSSEAQRAADQRQRDVEMARASAERARVTWSSLPEGGGKRRAEEAYLDAVRAKDEAVRRASDVALGAMRVGSADRGFRPGIDFDRLPGAVASTRTDADGRFTVRIPRSGRYVVAVALPTAGVWTPLGSMSGYWRASLDGQPRRRLTLRGETGVDGEPPFVIAYRPPR